MVTTEIKMKLGPKMVVLRPFTAEEPPSEAPLKLISIVTGRVVADSSGKV